MTQPRPQELLPHLVLVMCLQLGFAVFVAAAVDYFGRALG